MSKRTRHRDGPSDVESGKLTLPGQPGSVGRARRFVRTTLDAADRAGWAEAAELAASELVTNAVLHAHSDIELRVNVKSSHVRIEVRDRSSAFPMPRSYGATATTGRGLDLVARLSSDHGVEALAGGGKVVWCCVNSEMPAAVVDADFELDDWVDLVEATPTQATADDVDITLIGLPPTLWLAAREHHDALLRELALVQASLPDQHERSVLADDLAAADTARSRIGDAVVAAVERARRKGTASLPLPEHHPGDLPAVPATLDLDLRVRRDEVHLYARLQDVLDTGERLAQADELLARPGLPEIVAVRDWACEQIIAQTAGSPRARWVGADDERFAAVTAERSTADWSNDIVSQADTGMIAVDDANRIVAVSPPLLAALGWHADELVGRRVVAIVPARFREAHVAGFSRHLSTGIGRALDVSLRLPVLRGDGSEVECTLLIHAEHTPSGRTIYVARIEPA
jgi:PAS domain S-box-containing protein